MSDLVRLVYASRPTRPLSDAEMARLLESARTFNAARAVTGSLLVLDEVEGGPGAYVQWIEGPEEGVADSFDRIVRDDRHADLRVLTRAPADGRAYPTWSMRHEVVPAKSIDAALARFGLSATA